MKREFRGWSGVLGEGQWIRRESTIPPLDPWLPTVENILLRRSERRLPVQSGMWLAKKLLLYNPLPRFESGFSYSFLHLPYKAGILTCTNKSAPLEGNFSTWQGTLRFYPETEMWPANALKPSRVLTVWPSAKNSNPGRGILQAGEMKGFWLEFTSWFCRNKVIHNGFKIYDPKISRYSSLLETKLVWDSRKEQAKWLIYKPDEDGHYGFFNPAEEEKGKLDLNVLEDKVQVGIPKAPSLSLPPIPISCLEKV